MVRSYSPDFSLIDEVEHAGQTGSWSAMVIEELWYLFLLLFNGGIAFASVFIIAGAMRAALHLLANLTERVL